MTRLGSYVFLRDVHSGKVWSAGHRPIEVDADEYEVSEPYLARYGWGYTCFERSFHGLSRERLQTVPLDAPIKLSGLAIGIHADCQRHLLVTADVE